MANYHMKRFNAMVLRSLGKVCLDDVSFCVSITEKTVIELRELDLALGIVIKRWWCIVSMLMH